MSSCLPLLLIYYICPSNNETLHFIPKYCIPTRKLIELMDDQEDKPSFIAFIKEGLNTHQMKIPPKFLIKHLNEDFSSQAILIGPSGDQWQVTICKKQDNIYMQNGWPEFLTNNLVVPDEFLRFTYDGKNCFRVQIFGKNGCERLNLEKTRQVEAATPSLARTTKSGFASSSNLKELKSCQGERPLSNKGSLPKDNFSKPQISIEIERSNACKLAESFTSDKPWFKHLMTKSDVEPGLISNITAEFARQYLPESVTEIILQNSEGKCWEVTAKSTHIQYKRYARFSKGWQNFVRDNKLMKGDTCIFELASRNHMKVHIFKCAPN